MYEEGDERKSDRSANLVLSSESIPACISRPSPEEDGGACMNVTESRRRG